VIGVVMAKDSCTGTVTESVMLVVCCTGVADGVMVMDKCTGTVR
jgi:hypothetical protein